MSLNVVNSSSIYLTKKKVAGFCNIDSGLASIYSVCTESNDMAELTGVQKQYILHWGEMGTRWGINRTVAQIHALLYLSPGALPAEEIAETLSVARSNVSTSIRELETWGIVRAVHVLGDRREHYESMKDVWGMFRLGVEQRKRRGGGPNLGNFWGGARAVGVIGCAG